MKTIDMGQADLGSCLRDAQQERVVITRDGVPVALIVGLEGLDEEETRLSGSAEFWKLIADRRRQATVGRGALEQMILAKGAPE